MKNKLRMLPVFSHIAQLLLALMLLQFPVIGYCDTGSGWFKNLFESKGKNMKEVATKITTMDGKKEIRGLDFSPDGKYLVADTYFPETVQLWDWQSGRIVRTLEKARGANIGQVTESIRYSPDGHLLAACHSLALGDVVIRIWNTDTWEIVHDITDPQGGGGCNAIGFTPDGKSLIRVLNRGPKFPGDTLIIYSTDTWQPVWGMRTLPFQLSALAISQDGKFVALGGLVMPGGHNYSQIAIVDLAQREITRTIPIATIGRLAWSPDGARITIAAGGEVAIIDVLSGKQIARELLESAHMFVRYTPDSKYLLESDMDGLGNGLGVRIWDGQRRELLQTIPGNFNSLAVSRDGRYFAFSSDEKVAVWQLK